MRIGHAPSVGSKRTGFAKAGLPPKPGHAAPGTGWTRLILVCLLAGVAARIVCAQELKVNDLGTLEPGLRAAMAARERANVEGDTTRIETLLAPEYVQTDIGGRVQTRSEWLATYFRPLAEMIRAGEFRWTAWEETDVRTRSFGETVIAVGKLRLE
jgi:hypothetical protein